MGTESFPALLRTIQYFLLALASLSLIGIATVSYIYYKVRKYTGEEAMKDKEHMRNQMKAGLVFLIICVVLAAALFFIGPLLRLFFVGA